MTTPIGTKTNYIHITFITKDLSLLLMVAGIEIDHHNKISILIYMEARLKRLGQALHGTGLNGFIPSNL